MLKNNEGTIEMRVNSINAVNLNNASFGKVVKINTESALNNIHSPEIDPQTRSLIDIIEGKKLYVLNKKSLRIMGDFLRCKIGDYNSKNGLAAEKISGDVYVFTGKEAVAARKIIDKTNKNEVVHTQSQSQLVKDIKLSEIIGKARYTGTYGEIDAEFNNTGKLVFASYKNILNDD